MAKTHPSRQTIWQARRKAEGVCLSCGMNPPIAPSARCGKCLYNAKLSDRQRRGSRPWRAGGPGRPPIGARRTRGLGD